MQIGLALLSDIQDELARIDTCHGRTWPMDTKRHDPPQNDHSVSVLNGSSIQMAGGVWL